jgi:hypothetical protein
MQPMSWLRTSIFVGGALTLLFASASAQAETRNMVGSLGVVNPSTAPPFFFGGGPTILGKKLGPYAPNAGWTTISVDGTTPNTFVGRQVTLAAGKFDFTELVVRDFPAFPSVANLTNSAMSVQLGATFAEGAGALAGCPGPGCTGYFTTTATGGVWSSGTAISWCPPAGEPAGTPSPGTPGTAQQSPIPQIGDWNCASQQGAGNNALNVRIGISNSPGAPHFGGTFSLLRNWNQNVWRVLIQPGTDGIAEVSRTWRSLNNLTWTPGFPNFQYLGEAGNPGPRLKARLAPNGAVTRTLGCVNEVGTVGGGKAGGTEPEGPEGPVGGDPLFAVGNPFIGVGSNCGTPATPQLPLQAWGFKMTTGDVEGSDPFPFLSVTSAVAPTTPPPLGTAFSPNVNPRTAGQGFFFTRMGTDKTTGGTRRNIVLLGGGVARDPGSGNLFFRIMDLRLDMQVPEPGVGLGIMAGVSGLLYLGRRRRN